MKIWRKKIIFLIEKGGYFLLKLKKNCGYKIDDIFFLNSILLGVYDEINVMEVYL